MNAPARTRTPIASPRNAVPIPWILFAAPARAAPPARAAIETTATASPLRMVTGSMFPRSHIAAAKIPTARPIFIIDVLRESNFDAASSDSALSMRTMAPTSPTSKVMTAPRPTFICSQGILDMAQTAAPMMPRATANLMSALPCASILAASPNDSMDVPIDLSAPEIASGTAANCSSVDESLKRPAPV